jgi:Holin of 3TMs, for gene-transfer release
MALDPLTEAISFGHDIIDKIWPDKTAQAKERADAEAHVLDLAQQRFSTVVAAVQAADTAQANINAVEAASPRIWNSGWRPAIGWVGACALFVYYVPYALVATAIWAMQCVNTHTLVPRPDLGITDLIALISIMLGVSTQRMLEKFKGVAS